MPSAVRKKNGLILKLLALAFVGLAFVLDTPSLADTSLIQRAIRSFQTESIQTFPPPPSAEVAFSPNGGATELIVKTIASAQKNIRVAAYSFTSRPIANALIKAHEAGITVRVIVDESQTQKGSHSVAPLLVSKGIPVRADVVHALQHDKYIIVDEKTVETGSFNYSAAAEHRNAENVLVLWESPDIAAAYSQNWQKLWDQAEPYERSP